MKYPFKSFERTFQIMERIFKSTERIFKGFEWKKHCANLAFACLLHLFCDVDDEEMKLCTREGIKSNEIDVIVKYN